MNILDSFYDRLGISKSADLLSLRKAFRVKSKALHPDTTTLPSDQALKQFRQLCEAYEILSDPISRKQYDLTLENSSRKSLEEMQLKFVQKRNSFDDKDFVANNRRPFSSGELFSLLLLGISILVSLLLALGFALANGKQIETYPSWLVLNLIYDQIFTI